jgi:hypothetical protein
MAHDLPKRGKAAMPAYMRRVLRQQKTNVARFLVSAIILIALFAVIDLDVMIEKLTLLDAAAFATAIALLCGQMLLAAVRWHSILTSVGAKLSLRQSIDNFIAGGLGNIVFLTSIGGLSVRGFLLVRRGWRLRLIIAALIAERLAVAAALVFVFIIAALIAGERYAEMSDLVAGYGLTILSLSGIGILLAGLILLHFVGKTDSGWFRDLATHLSAALHRPGETVLVLALSCAVHLTGFAAVAVLAAGIGVEIPTAELFTVMPLVALLSAIPVSLGGWGVREGSMVIAFSMLGVGAEETIAISVLYGLSGIVSALILAAVFLLRSKPDEA